MPDDDSDYSPDSDDESSGDDLSDGDRSDDGDRSTDGDGNDGGGGGHSSSASNDTRSPPPRRVVYVPPTIRSRTHALAGTRILARLAHRAGAPPALHRGTVLCRVYDPSAATKFWRVAWDYGEPSIVALHGYAAVPWMKEADEQARARAQMPILGSCHQLE